MTAPTKTPASLPAANPIQGGAKPFGASTPPDHRTTALQSAVAVLRGGKPAPKTGDVLDMAEEFYQFLKKK